MSTRIAFISGHASPLAALGVPANNATAVRRMFHGRKHGVAAGYG